MPGLADITDPLLAAVDEVVTTWPDVRARNVFGHRGYVRSGRMFGFLDAPGVAVKAVDEKAAEALLAADGARIFTYNDMPMRNWPVLPLRSEADLETALTELKRSYEGVGA